MRDVSLRLSAREELSHGTSSSRVTAVSPSVTGPVGGGEHRQDRTWCRVGADSQPSRPACSKRHQHGSGGINKAIMLLMGARGDEARTRRTAPTGDCSRARGARVRVGEAGGILSDGRERSTRRGGATFTHLPTPKRWGLLPIGHQNETLALRMHRMQCICELHLRKGQHP